MFDDKQNLLTLEQAIKERALEPLEHLEDHEQNVHKLCEARL